MREIKIPMVVIMSGICGVLSLLPLAGHGADLIIGNNVSTSGNWSLNGGITATSFSGSGSGLTSVTASNLNCNGCVSPSELSFIPGSITGVTAVIGLTGGGGAGNVSLSVDFDGSGGAGTAARSDHHHDHLYLWKYGKVAIVAQSGGDYPNPYAAMVDSDNWCGPASETNPCLVKIMPGVYDVGGSSVQMKDYIDIEGSGENTTKIKGNISSNESGVVRGSTFAELRFLSVENSGGGEWNIDAIAMYNNMAAPKITNLTLTARNGGKNSVALYNKNLSSPVLTNVTLEAFDGANYSMGVWSINLCAPQLKNVKIKASGAPQNVGVQNEQYVVTIMNNVNIEVSGDSSSIWNMGAWICTNSAANIYNSSIVVNGPKLQAINNQLNCTLNIENSSITANGTSSDSAIAIINYMSGTVILKNTSIEAKSGSLNIGVQNASDGGNVIIDHSSITGAQTSIRNDSSTASFKVGASKLDGEVAGPTLCVSSYNGSYAAVGTDCR
jgi:hypothetical protein